jgi:hypothetical protein
MPIMHCTQKELDFEIDPRKKLLDFYNHYYL